MILLALLLFLTVIAPVIFADEDSLSNLYRPMVRSSSKQWHFSTDYVRCFCNLPACVTTGYMCKSNGGGCFSDVLDQSSSYYRGKHGCVELLTEKNPKWKCQTKGGNERTVVKWKDNPKSLLLCCYHDMCNHVENTPLKTIINSTVLNDVTVDTNQQQQETLLYSNSEIWFRAATIAVPICGAVILFVLIALAVKILKTEHQNSTVQKLGPALYVHTVPQDYKQVRGEKRHQAYDNLLRKSCPSTHLHHQNLFLRDEEYPHPRQVELPLLIGNASNDLDKNTRNRVAEERSIVLAIEKDSRIDVVNVNDDQCCEIEKTVLS